MPSEILDRLNQQKAEAEPTRVITVRMKKTLHERLKELAHELKTSLNCFCVAALEAATEDPELVQSQEGGRIPPAL